MKQVYFLIPAQDARKLGVTEFRRGNQETGYIVTPGDMVVASEDIKQSAEEVSEAEAIRIINSL